MNAAKKKCWLLIFGMLLILVIVCVCFFSTKKTKVYDKREHNVSNDKTNIDVLNERNQNPREKEVVPKSYIAAVPIYMYHWIKEDTGGYEYPEMMVKPSELKKHFEYIANNSYDDLFVSEVSNVYKYKKPIVLTFDDGWQDVYANAYPLAKEYNVKFSMYVIKDLVGTPGYCTEDELMEMKESGLVEIGSHTITHRKLASLTKDEIYNELSESKKYLKESLGIDTNVICYPSGSFNSSVVKIANELGYELGLAMDGGIYYSNKDSMMEMSRIFVTRSMSLGTFITYASKSSVSVEW